MPSEKPGAWYQNAAWDDAAQALFWKKLKAARREKAWAANAKAGILWATGDPTLRSAARDLLSRAAEQGIPVELQLARFALDEGDLVPAEKLFRRGLAQATEQGQHVEAAARSLGRVLARSPDPAHQREARELFETWFRAAEPKLMGPWEQVAASLPDFDDFATIADEFVKGYRARDAATGEALGRYEASSVEALDRAVRLQGYPWLRGGIDTPLAPGPRDLVGLGAYLGVLLQRYRGGRWNRRSPSLLSTVTVDDRELDPHRHAREVVLFERLPGELF